MIIIDDNELLTVIPDNIKLYSGIIRDSTDGIDGNNILTGDLFSSIVNNITTEVTQDIIVLTDTNLITIAYDNPYQVIVTGIIENNQNNIDSNIIYTLALDPLNPTEMEFIIVGNQIVLPNNVTGIVQVFYLTEIPITTTVLTNYINPPYPDFISEWDCVGEISISKSFQSHPNINLSFFTTIPESTIRTTLQKGSVHRFYGMDYEVSSLSITRYSADKTGNIYQRKIDVSLQGIWYNKANKRNPLDESIYLRSLTKSYSSVSLSTLCSAVGVDYSGSKIEIDFEEIDAEATIEIRNEFESRAVINNEFYYYSNSNKIEAKEYPSTIINLLINNDIKTRDYKVDLPGTGAFYDDVQLVKEYRNTELQLDITSTENNTNTTYSLYTFENAKDKADVFSYKELELRGSAYYVIDNSLRFQDNSMNWDSSGLTKAYTLTTYYNSQVIKIDYTKYGFVYNSLDCYEFRQNNDNQWVAHYISPNQSNLWQVVEQWTETIVTDSNGYVTDRIKSGFRFHRYQQETENLECVDLYIKYLESTNGDEQLNLLKQIDTYKGEKVSFTENTGNELSRFDSYYQDMVSNNCDQENWYPKKFIKTSLTMENTVLKIENPAHELDAKELPELSAGKKFLSRNDVKIITPQSITETPNIEIYEVIDFAQNSEGERFKNGLKIATTTENEGRPSEAERIETNEETEENNTVYNTDYKYIINSSGSDISLSDPIQDSLSFPDVKDINIALSAAKTQLSIDNLDAESITLELNNRKTWNEGELVLFNNKYYVIMSITDNQQILKSKLTSSSYNITLGRLLLPNVTLSEKIIQDECT